MPNETNTTDFNTPMMQQYMKIKQRYSDCILFFRLGDFYEMFLDDAKIGAEVLGITLTARARGEDGSIPMAGVPYHAADSYIAKLVRAGYKIAICEQLGVSAENIHDSVHHNKTTELQKSKLFKRDVVRVVTPGTIMDDKTLEKKENVYVACIRVDESSFGFAAVDLSTGLLFTTQQRKENIKDALTKFNPRECILTEELYENHTFLKLLKDAGAQNIYKYVNHSKDNKAATQQIKKHFNVKSLEGLGLIDKPLAVDAVDHILSYLNYTQKDQIPHIKSVMVYHSTQHVQLDKSTILNLELLHTIRNSEHKGSLLSCIDRTLTPMGGRLLKQWLLSPLIDKAEINKRLECVEYYVRNRPHRNDVSTALAGIGDIERILSRISVGIGTPRDVLGLASALNSSLAVKDMLGTTGLEKELATQIVPELKDIVTLIERNIQENPLTDPKQGNLIKDGINMELDKLRHEIKQSKDFIAALETHEKARAGIGSLKVKFNKVFGYYIEISKANLGNVPQDYIRKQTLVNAERFITPELKEHEEIILTAEEKINELEYEIFLAIVETVSKNALPIQRAAQSIAILDCILGFAELAEMENYIKPSIVTDGSISIVNGRHPVVEKLLDNAQFVPNNVVLNTTNSQLHIITGPNMAGKSVFIRQVALITLLAQIGSYVPADEATISIVDKIFVRSGAADIITEGLSTFMVEMVETANILNNATTNSLIVMDEIGRGTSTYDGISIAWAVAEYLVQNDKKISPKTLFATHYHELAELSDKFPKKVKNFQVAVSENKGEPVFIHKVIPGAASHSYGISVAKLAGIPLKVTSRAGEILEKLEAKKN